MEMGKKLVVPILTIMFGVTWLLNVKQIVPGVDWMWTIGLATGGLLNVILGGLNKVTIVTGPFLLVASGCSYLRQTKQIPIDQEIPILIIVLGILMLVSQLSPLKMPEELQIVDDEKK